jgi:hypothetical protein
MTYLSTKKQTETFVDTNEAMEINGQSRPVLKLGDRLYVGETLCMLNPAGFGGRIWTAKNREQLRYNAHFRRQDGGNSR